MIDTPDSVIVDALMPARSGLSAPQLRRLLRPAISQPTLWRILDRMRSAGRIRVSGKARATRYHLATPMDVATRRSL